MLKRSVIWFASLAASSLVGVSVSAQSERPAGDEPGDASAPAQRSESGQVLDTHSIDSAALVRASGGGTESEHSEPASPPADPAPSTATQWQSEPQGHPELQVPRAQPPVLMDTVLPPPPGRSYRAWSALWGFGLVTVTAGLFAFFITSLGSVWSGRPNFGPAIGITATGGGMVIGGVIAQILAKRRYLRALREYEMGQVAALAW